MDNSRTTFDPSYSRSVRGVWLTNLIYLLATVLASASPLVHSNLTI